MELTPAAERMVPQEEKALQHPPVRLSLCPTSGLEKKISIRRNIMHCFHIETAPLGFKSSVTYVILGKVVRRGALTQTTSPQ